MRLTIPEPKIKLYEDGFTEHDKLSRKTTGDKLSELVERIDEPLVIALDGAWGSGKSFFLKCWVGEHLKREGNTTQTVYFDAFKHDFLDDPLIALTGAIAERFEESGNKTAQKAWDKAKRVAPALGRAIIRAGVSVATAGLVNKADELADAAIETASRELDGAVAEFWKRESGKRVAMESFRQALVDLTKPDASGTPTQKMIVVIDELDRCRPDFALSTLETIKHFFNVAGIHFVLGVNMMELQNSVRARYGGQTNASGYLQKFMQVQFELPVESRRSAAPTLPNFLNYVSDLTNCNDTQGIGLLSLYTDINLVARQLTLRDIERLCTLAATTTPINTEWGGKYATWLIPGLLILKIKKPELYSALRDGKLPIEEVFEQIGLTELENKQGSPERPTKYYFLRMVWRYYLEPSFNSTAVVLSKVKDPEKSFVPEDLRGVPRSELLATYINEYLEVFRPV